MMTDDELDAIRRFLDSDSCDAGPAFSAAGDLLEDVDRLRAENGKLRQALKRICHTAGFSSNPYVNRLGDVASEALGETE